MTTHDATEARTNHAVVTKAQQTVVVADGCKVGRVALAQTAGLDRVATLVTDGSADPGGWSASAPRASRSSSRDHWPEAAAGSLTP